MTSTDPLTERYVALGRIFRYCLVALARADADYLEGPRARVTLYRGALVGLNVIAEAIARRAKPASAPLRGRYGSTRRCASSAAAGSDA